MLRLRRRRKPKPGLAAKTEVRSGLRRPSQRLLPILAAICLAAAIPQSQAFNKDKLALLAFIKPINLSHEQKLVHQVGPQPAISHISVQE